MSVVYADPEKFSILVFYVCDRINLNVLRVKYPNKK